MPKRIQSNTRHKDIYESGYQWWLHHFWPGRLQSHVVKILWITTTVKVSTVSMSHQTNCGQNVHEQFMNCIVLRIASGSWICYWINLTTQSYHWVMRLYRRKLKKSRIFIYRDKWEEFMQPQCNYHIHFGTAVFPKLMIDRAHFHQTYCVKHLLWMRLLFPMNCGQNLHRQSITLMEYGQISEKIRTHKTVATWHRAQTPKSHFSQLWRLLYLVCSKKGSVLLMRVSLLVLIFVLLALYCPQRSTQYSWDLSLYHVSLNLIGLSILGGKQIVLSSQRIILCLFVVSCFRTKLDKLDDFISIYLWIM